MYVSADLEAELGPQCTMYKEIRVLLTRTIYLAVRNSKHEIGFISK